MPENSVLCWEEKFLKEKHVVFQQLITPGNCRLNSSTAPSNRCSMLSVFDSLLLLQRVGIALQSVHMIYARRNAPGEQVRAFYLSSESFGLEFESCACHNKDTIGEEGNWETTSLSPLP